MEAGETTTVDLTLTAELAVLGDVVSGDRVDGETRYDTAAELSEEVVDPDIDVAYVATGENSADALAGGVAAGVDAAPVLLATADALPEATSDELDRLEPERIAVLGGESAIGADVEDELADHTDGTVDRLAGADRYQTAADVADELDEPTGAFVATGEDYADALGAGAVAGTVNAPVLLTSSEELPEATGDALDGLAPETIVVMGGEEAVNTDVAEAVQSYVAD